MRARSMIAVLIVLSVASLAASRAMQDQAQGAADAGPDQAAGGPPTGDPPTGDPVAGDPVAGGPVAGDPATEIDRAAVLAANEAFYSALKAMFRGDPKPFKQVWWHDDDVVYLGADGAFNVGWDQAYANWIKQARLELGGTVSVTDVRVVVGADMAMTNQIVNGVNGLNGKPVRYRLRSTSVFQKRDGAWKLVGHHVDEIPQLRAEETGGSTN